MAGAWDLLKKLKLVEDVNDAGEVVTSKESLEELLGATPFEPDTDEAAPAVAPELPIAALKSTGEGGPDFKMLFETAGIKEGPNSIERAIELRANLPADQPLAAQRQVVLAALKSFKIDVKALVKDAAAKHGVIQSYLQSAQKELQTFNDDTARQIAELEAQINALRNERDSRRVEHETLTTACGKLRREIEQAVDFLTEGDMITAKEQGDK